MKDMKELFSKKKKISDNERDAKMSVLKEVSDMAGSAMGDKLKGLKKVSVSAPDKKGLELGLKKAEELVGGPESEGEESQEHEDSESPEMESSEDMLEAHKECPGCSECIDAKLAELSKKKEELQKSE